MSQIYAHKRSNDDKNIEEIEDVDVILNKLSSLNNAEGSNRSEVVNKRMSKHLMEIISNLEHGILISTIQNGTYTLYISLGQEVFIPLFSNQNGILPGFREFKDHIRSSNNLKTMNPKNIKKAGDFKNDEEITVYKAKIIENINRSRNYLSTFEDNLKQMYELETGDIIDFNRGIYSHSAIFDKNGYKVIHRNGEPGSKTSFTTDLMNKAIVVEENLIDVMFESKFYKNNHLDNSQTPRKPHEIIKYARERLGDKGYNLVTENCQHFATECRYGVAQSHEVITTASYLAGGLAIAGTLIGGYFFAKKKIANKNEKEKREEDRKSVV